MKTIKVVAAVICDSIKDKKQILATARGYGEFKGQWEFPGGKIEKGETPQQALVREIKEELEVNINVGELIDTIEYDYRLSTYKENREGLDMELMLFLVDNYFDDFVFSNSVLREMYLEFEVRGIDFMREFRKMLSEHIGEDVVYLNKAKSLVKKNNNPIYCRGFLGGSIYE